jgi:hypothetical protein
MISVVIPDEKYKKDVISVLESAINRAKEGQFNSILLIAELDGSTKIWSDFSGSKNKVDLIGKIRILEHDVMVSME